MSASTTSSLSFQPDVLYHEFNNFFDQYLNTSHPVNGKLALILLFANHSFIIANILYTIFKSQPRVDGTKRIPFLAGFLMMFVAGMGGAIINALITAQPQLFLQNDAVVVLFASAWILVTNTFGIVHHLTNNLIVKAISYGVEGWFVAITVMGAVEGAAAKFPNSHIAPVLIGTISAIGGGGLLMPAFMNLYLGESRLSNEITRPSISLYLAFAVSLFYYLSARLGLFSVNFTLDISATEAIQVTPRMIIGVVYVFFFLFLYFRGTILVLFQRKPAVAKTVKPESEGKGTPVSETGFASAQLADKLQKEGVDAFQQKLLAVRAQKKKEEHALPSAAQSASTKKKTK